MSVVAAVNKGEESEDGGRAPLCWNADVGEGKRTSAKAVEVGIEKRARSQRYWLAGLLVHSL